MHREEIQTDFIYTDAESRTCTSILDSEKQTLTEIYELGELIPPVKVDELLAHIRAIIGNYQAVTLSGSLPPGVPTDFYARVIEVAKEANVLAFFDSSGEALRKGAEATPFFIKPNETEARSLLGIEANRPIDFAQAAVEISATYRTNVLLSMGANGAIATNGQKVFIVKSPAVEAKSAVGSGDCMLAGLTYGITQGFSFAQAVTYGVAAGTANTLMIGAGQFRIDDFKRLCNEVQITAQPG